MTTDLILSAGWLAFARHIGVLDAITAHHVDIGAVVGTSSGALVGALWAAGHAPDVIAAEVVGRSPLASLRPSWTPWRGLLSMSAVVARLQRLLPPTFGDLDRPFAVGVATVSGGLRLLRDGPLPEAVAASCAVPGLFAPVSVGGTPCLDGGWVDRTALEAWRAWRGPTTPGLLHLVAPSSRACREPEPGSVAVVRTPPSGARLWNLGPFEAQRAEARALASGVLAG